jgi:hypothetical protein
MTRTKNMHEEHLSFIIIVLTLVLILFIVTNEIQGTQSSLQAESCLINEEIPGRFVSIFT